MWKQLLEALKFVFTFAQRLERQEQGLKEQQRENKDTALLVQRLAVELQRTQDELQRLQEREETERKILKLELENHLLRAAHGLPPAKPEPIAKTTEPASAAASANGQKEN